MRTDVLVLGAGIVGVSIALHLQKRGRDVILVERNPGAGEGTSYGNAGIIERSSLLPYLFPRDLGTLFKYALNTRADAHYHLSALPRIAPWLYLYWKNSTEARKKEIMAANLPMIENCVAEHEILAAEAGVGAALRPGGWIKAFRTQRGLDTYLRDIQPLADHGITVEALDPTELSNREPHLTGDFAGGAHLVDPVTVADPEGLTKAYATLFTKRGGRFIRADARTLTNGSGWSIATDGGTVSASQAVLAMGPWSDDVTRSLGYRLPLGVKRGYHMHYGAVGNATLNHPVLDAEVGYVLAPMSKGIRLTSGAEFADRDAPPTPVQIDRAERRAREIFPLDKRLEDEPWLGRRPCFPDLIPVLGEAPRHPGLWFAFGHHHHGLTLGAVTGRLLGEMMTGDTPFTNPAPYRADRFERRA
jgi:D-amino-acid dehydrogenase